MREETVGRIGSMFSGLFLFFFGLPFTLVPLMMLSWGAIDPDYPFESLFAIIFSIPFLMAGLLVQFFGLSMIRGGLRGTTVHQFLENYHLERAKIGLKVAIQSWKK